MKWYRAHLYGLRQDELTPTDIMGNPLCEETELGSILVRDAPVRQTQDDTEGNLHKYVQRCFITKAEWRLLEGVVAIQVGSIKYDVLYIALADGCSVITCRCDRPFDCLQEV